MKKSVAIIGAGASGLVCAVTLARRGFDVTLFDKNRKIGKKLLATGNGRCNISNEDLSLKNFYGDEKLIKNLLNSFDMKKFCQSIGLELTTNQEGKIFPMSMQASSVVNLLLSEAERLKIKIVTDKKIKSLEKIGSNFIIDKERFDFLVLSCGSKAYPSLGGDESCLALAKNFNHSVTPVYDSLTQLVTKENLKELDGVRVEAVVRLFVNGDEIDSKRGDLLFRDYGVSGLSVLDLSKEASKALHVKGFEVSLIVELLPELSAQKLKSKMFKNLEVSYDKEMSLWLSGFLDKKLSKFFSFKRYAKDLNKKDISKLVYNLKNLKLQIIDTKGFQRAEVMAGGVDTKEIDVKTLESKKCKNLYLCGEVLDIDGKRGGYNLHLAFSSGALVGEGIGI